jgi:hypothetical protein
MCGIDRCCIARNLPDLRPFRGWVRRFLGVPPRLDNRLGLRPEEMADAFQGQRPGDACPLGGTPRSIAEPGPQGQEFVRIGRVRG